MCINKCVLCLLPLLYKSAHYTQEVSINILSVNGKLPLFCFSFAKVLAEAWQRHAHILLNSRALSSRTATWSVRGY